MRLRTRLFIWVGSLFASVFVIFYILENYFTKSSLEIAEDNLGKSIAVRNETQRQEILTYLNEEIDKVQSHINALLTRIKSYPPYYSTFVQASNQSTMDWLNCSTLIADNDWIDFIKIVRDDKSTCLITVQDSALESIRLNTTKEGINVLSDSSGRRYIGLPLIVQDFLPDKAPLDNPSLLNAVSFFVLFDANTIKNFDLDAMHFKILNLSINPLEPFLRWVETTDHGSAFVYFMKHLKNAQNALKADPNYLNKVVFDVEQTQLVRANSLTGTQKELDRLDQIGLIWGMTSLLGSGPFGGTPFDKNAPIGIARVDPEESHIKVVFNSKVFFRRVLENPEEFQKASEPFEDVIKVLKTLEKNKYYFGNVFQFNAPDASTYLTIGVDGRFIQKNLSLILGKISLFVMNGQIVTALGEDGSIRTDIDISDDALKAISKQVTGYTQLFGKKYYFMRIPIVSGSSFDYILLTPDKEEFLLIEQLNQSVQDVITKTSLQVKIGAVIAIIVVLLILGNLSKRITRPISILAAATLQVKKGRFDQAVLPQYDFKSQDEVYTLYQAFNEMIKGLRETEKVRAVLNKVVSPEIASEFLKEEPVLGGETKQVTMLFGDIRNFTHITEKMPPREVILLINTCMTKISHIIDQYHGVIDKYVGDEVMALFGAPIKRETSTEDAISSAIDMVKALHEWNKERKAKGLDAMEMGFGIHTGQVVAGNMGAENRLNYTVLGSNVNLTSRLCSIAKPMEILISESVYNIEKVRNMFQIEPLSTVELKGFSVEFKIYRVLGKRV